MEISIKPNKEFSNIIKVFSGPEIRVEDLSKTYSKERIYKKNQSEMKNLINETTTKKYTRES